MFTREETEEFVQQLRRAIVALNKHALCHAAKFASELLLGIPYEIRKRVTTSINDFHNNDIDDDPDLFAAAKACFDTREYLRAHHTLSNGNKGADSKFLMNYSLYMAGEKAKEEMMLEISVAGVVNDASNNQHRNSYNPHLNELYLSLKGDFISNSLDSFGMYLFAIVLKGLGYCKNGMNKDSDEPMFDEETKVERLEDHVEYSDSINPRLLLIKSIQLFPYNWSAWLELASLSLMLSVEDEEKLKAANPIMFHLFLIHFMLEQQHDPELAMKHLHLLSPIFPNSTYLLSQQALCSYHLRDFDQAQSEFKELIHKDPFRVSMMDVYSNVLYVKEDKSALSMLAHKATRIEKFCPETCCIIGNYYSLKSKHDKAIIYFNRALKLDPNYISAWTLIGHEYVELKHTSAAIEAYRHAVELNSRDYRAWYGLGQAYEILNMFLYSIHYYKKAASIRPFDARMWCAVGNCYEKVQKIDRAIATYKRAEMNDDREREASYNLGRLYKIRQQKHEATKYYRKHLNIPEELVQIMGNESVEYHSLRSMKTPQSVEAMLYLASYYKESGNHDEARIFCNILLDLEGPEREEAKFLLREMRSTESNSLKT